MQSVGILQGISYIHTFPYSTLVVLQPHAHIFRTFNSLDFSILHIV